MLRRTLPPLRPAINYGPLRSSHVLRARTTPQRNLSWQRWSQRWSQKPKDDAIRVYFPSEQPTISLRRRIIRSAGRGIATVIVFYACWQVFAAVVIDPLLHWADEEYENSSEQEKKEIDESISEEDEILFLPFPFTTKTVNEPPYKGSDPEWEMFVSVNRDKKWQMEIKNGLLDVVLRGIERNPNVVRTMGGNLRKGKFWLDIIYPPSPPPKHIVSGITIDDGGIFWSEQPIDSQAANRLNMALYPKAVALTAWTFIDVLVSTTFHDIASTLGFNTSQPANIPWQTAVIKRMNEMSGTPAGSGGTLKPSTAEFPSQNSSIFPSSSPSPSSQTSQTPQLAGASIGGSETSLDPRIVKALYAANLTFMKTWRPPPQPPTRGCVRIDGLIELHGNAASMVVVAWAWYDPKAKKYIGIQMGIKHLVPRKQTPAGGR